MVGRKNIAIIIAMGQIATASFAMFEPQFTDTQQLYTALLKTQGNTNPMENNPAVEQASRIARRQNFEFILKNAETTGLIRQCELLLTQPSFINIDYFISPESLQVIAYMQNKYGNGNPFTYNEKSDSPNPSESVVLGTYVNPSRQMVNITRYSFLHTLIQTLYTLSVNPQIASNQYFQNIRAQIDNNLSIAIKNSQRPAALDPRIKLSSLVKQIGEVAQRYINLNAMSSIEIMNTELERALKAASFGRG